METLKNADWRIDTVSTLSKPWTSPWSGETHPAGALVKKVTIARLNRKQTLTVTIPNASALFLNIARRAYSQALSIRRVHFHSSTRRTEISLDDETAFTYLETMFEAVVCAHTATEAFVNELLPADKTYKRKNRSGEIEILSKAEIERRASLTEKVGTFLPVALGIKSPKGIHRAYTDLQALTKIRDRLIHMKSVDRKSSGPEIDTVWHQLVICESPIDQAMSIIRCFVPNDDKCPRWLTSFPRK